MSAAEIAVLVAVGISALAALGSLFAIFRTVFACQTVPEAPPDFDAYPKVSIIVPACNEADTIEAGTRAKLATDYPDLEVVLVEDRSTDDTPRIADALAAADPRVRVVHVDHLPEGWLGKVHALDVGVRGSTGEWFILSDADVYLSPSILRRTLAEAERRGLDFVAVIPKLRPAGFVLDAILSYFMRAIVVAGRVWAVPDPESKAAVGGGTFMAVRRSAYDASPGFEWLKLEIGDDIAFGQMMKKAGARCRVYNGPDDVQVTFYPTVALMMRGMEKNGFTVAGQYSIAKHVVVQCVGLWLEVGCWAALATPWWSVRALGLAGIVVLAATNVIVSRWAKRALLPALFPCLGALVFATLISRAALLAVVRGGVTWRGTFYKLEDLRRGMRIELPF